MVVWTIIIIKFVMNLSLVSGIFTSLKGMLENAILQLNRNGRFPKRANHGARPCSSVMRRMKKREYYRRWKPKTPLEMEDWAK